MSVRDIVKEYRKLAAANHRTIARGRVSTTDSQQRARQARDERRFELARQLPTELAKLVQDEFDWLGYLASDAQRGMESNPTVVERAKQTTKAINALVKQYS